MREITLQLPDPVRAWLEQKSRETGRPVEDLAGDALRRAVAVEQLRRIRRELRPYAERAGFLTDEDVFREVS